MRKNISDGEKVGAEEGRGVWDDEDKKTLGPCVKYLNLRGCDSVNSVRACRYMRFREKVK
jgi:hypothetical protein